MHKPTLLFLAILPCLISANKLVDLVTGTTKCQTFTFGSTSTECAVLFDDDDCDGWAEPIAIGERELGILRINDAEAVKVKKGCTFTGYQHSSPDVGKRGLNFTLSGTTDDAFQNLKGESQLESKISYVLCKC